MGTHAHARTHAHAAHEQTHSEHAPTRTHGGRRRTKTHADARTYASATVRRWYERGTGHGGGAVRGGACTRTHVHMTRTHAQARVSKRLRWRGWTWDEKNTNAHTAHTAQHNGSRRDTGHGDDVPSATENDHVLKDARAHAAACGYADQTSAKADARMRVQRAPWRAAGVEDRAVLLTPSSWMRPMACGDGSEPLAWG